MRLVSGALLTIALAVSAPASAQNSDSLAGTWAFQSEPYGGGQQGFGIMSGTAVVTADGANRYAVRFITNEMIVAGSRPTQLLTARQTCRIEQQDAQISMTCEMAEPLEGYRPDSFVLQRGERDQLVGALRVGQGSATVTFSRMR